MRSFKLFRVGYCCGSLDAVCAPVDLDGPRRSLDKVLERLGVLEPEYEIPEPNVLKIFRKIYPYTDSLGPVSIPNDSTVQHAVPRFEMVPVVPCLRADEDDGRWNPCFTYPEHAHGNDWRWLIEVRQTQLPI